MADDKSASGIWLEVAEVQFDQGTTKVQLKGDREHPKPVWWCVDPAATVIAAKPADYEVYKAILHEMDKKRTVLARLSCADVSAGKRRAQRAQAAQRTQVELRCTALRFQSADLGSRSS